jgi:hypothetical protein
MATRVLAAIGAAGLGLLALFGAILLIFLAAAAAEPGTATNRGGTLVGSVVLVLLEGALVAGVLVLALYAAAGRFLAWRAVVGGTLAGALALGLLAGFTL